MKTSDPDAIRDRPSTDSRYGIPAQEQGLLPWSFVERGMADDQVYWVCTTRPDGCPHTRPTWGVWVNGRFYCGGGERTRWVRNLQRNPAIAVHREDGESVVIVEGTAELRTGDNTDTDLIDRLDAAYERKYDMPHGTPFIEVVPTHVLAWSDFPSDATRWRFTD